MRDGFRKGLTDPNLLLAARVTQAMMKMVKLDVAALESAFTGA